MTAEPASVARPSLWRRRWWWMLPWHLVLLIVFVAAFLSGGQEGLEGVHLYTGWGVVALLALRVLVALKGGNFSLPRLWAPGRRRLVAWMTAVVLLTVPAAAVSGLPAGASDKAAGLHSELSDLAAGLVTLHAAVVIVVLGG